MPSIAACDAIPVVLPMTATFATSRGAVGSPATGRPLVLVRLTDEHGRCGWGEAGPLPTWSAETLGSVVDAVGQHLGPAVLGRDPGDLGGLHAALDTAIVPGMPIAKSAVDLAAFDLLGRQTGQPLWRLLGRRGREAITLSWTVLADASVAAGRAAGFRHFNLKVGGRGGADGGLAADAAAVRAVRVAAGADAFVWADANGAYAPHLGLPAARSLAAAGADVLEQPLPPRALLACARVVAAGALPVALDESTASPPELSEAIALGALDVHVLKVTRTGGLFPARICAEMALASGLGLLASGLTDGGLAFAAGVGLAAAFDVERPCALNGPQLLGDDVLATPLRREGDRVWAPEGPGLGVEVDEEKVARYRLRG